MERELSTLITGACPIALAFLCGCSHAAPAPRLAAYEPAPAAVPAPRPAAAPLQASAIHVSDEILAACRTSDSKVGDTPLFAFDSAVLSRAARHLLKEVADCLTVGPLAGRALKLVGRADPRGTEDYNLRLGDRRARSAERYLEASGMASSSLVRASRGALDAPGHDERGWQRDRRVDIDLAG